MEVDKSLTFQERRQEIAAIIKDIGFSNINVSELARQFDVSRETIYNDIKCLGSDCLDNSSAAQMLTELVLSYQELLREARGCTGRGTDWSTRFKGVEVLGRCVDRYTKLLCLLGIIKKANQ